MDTLDGLIPSDAALLLLYDGHCSICRGSVEFLRRRQGSQRLHMQPLQEGDAVERLGLDPQRVREELHVIDRGGQVFQGADAVFRALAELPRWRWTGPLFSVPGVGPVSRRVYRFIAENRPQDECESGACAVRRR